MNEKEATDLLKKIEHIGVDVWIGGGWGVDALLGQLTRPHNDIDIYIEKKDAAVFIEMMISDGYSETKMEFTTNDHTAWRDGFGRTIDLHLFEFAENDTLLFENVAYPAGVLNGKGTIGGVSIRCMTAEAQLLFHQGYEHKEKDIHDVLLLCKTFGLQIPEQYENL